MASNYNNKILSSLQKLGKALMTPVAVLPAAGLLLRLGQQDVLNLPWMAQAGDAIFANLPLIFAIGIAVGLADENNGISGLAAAVGYFVLTKVSLTFNDKIDMGVLAGIIVGVLAAHLYNKYKTIKLPDFLGFFGGKRFIPIITSIYSLLLGILTGYVWPHIQGWISILGNSIASSGSVGAFFYGLLNRLLIPFGLHHVINPIIWLQCGDFTNAAGKVFHGDLTRFFQGDPTAGTFMTGFFPIMMFGLPAACIAMIVAAKKENKKAVTGMLLGVAFTSFLTGVTEPIEFLFMFLSPLLYVIHSILTAISLAVTAMFGIKSGFTFSAGAIDLGLNWGISTKPLLLLLVGLIFSLIYFFVFLFLIKKLNIPTPGREDNEEISTLSGLNNKELENKASKILQAIGGKDNISSIDACITRIRLISKDPSKVNEIELKKLGATGIMKMGSNNYQIIVGTVADPLVTYIKDLMK
ncbi:N-acetylglucosamine-specific PTS transporter subunit IIBC [Haloimpatiens sp. FM7315]|uniref:N-acetylglucosamine-specific PTS transporter subunit IIBC n=1 Tax=Haloimpatiens sp. FM7315 TaxID=3298609 RepID=UPI0035A3937C